MSESSINDNYEKYYASEDPSRPICRQFVNQGKCPKRRHCQFYHPKVITHTITKQAKRELGHCYCGAPQKTIISYQRSQEDKPNFFVVCGRTGRSMRRCM